MRITQYPITTNWSCRDHHLIFSVTDKPSHLFISVSLDPDLLPFDKHFWDNILKTELQRVWRENLNTEQGNSRTSTHSKLHWTEVHSLLLKPTAHRVPNAPIPWWLYQATTRTFSRGKKGRNCAILCNREPFLSALSLLHTTSRWLQVCMQQGRVPRGLQNPNQAASLLTTGWILLPSHNLYVPNFQRFSASEKPVVHLANFH